MMALSVIRNVSIALNRYSRFAGLLGSNTRESSESRRSNSSRNNSGSRVSK